jgi:hypothetical protein
MIVSESVHKSPALVILTHLEMLNTNFDQLISVIASASDDFNFMPLPFHVFFPITPGEPDPFLRNLREISKMEESVAYHKGPVNSKPGNEITGARHGAFASAY